jgi:hypothetical protein
MVTITFIYLSVGRERRAKAPHEGPRSPNDGPRAPDEALKALNEGLTAPNEGLTAPNEGLTAPNEGRYANDVNTSRTREEGAHSQSWPNGFIIISSISISISFIII